MLSLIIEKFIENVANNLESLMEQYVSDLASRGVPVFCMERSFISNFGNFSLIVEYSNALRDYVDATTIEYSIMKFGSPASYVMAFFARSFAESAFKLAKKKPVVLFSLGTLTAFGDAYHKIMHLMDFMRDNGFRFRIINSYESLFSMNYDYQEADVAFSWFLDRGVYLGPDFFLKRLMELFLDRNFWFQKEDFLYPKIARALMLVGFDVHDKFGGEYADLYILRPLKIVIEVKNEEKVGKDAVEQVIRYTKNAAEIDKYLNNTIITGPWLPMVIGYEFTAKAIEYAEEKRVVLLDSEGLILFLKYFSIVPPSRLSIVELYQRGGLVNEILKRKLEDANRDFLLARMIINYLHTNPSANLNQLESSISETIGASKDKILRVLESIKMFPKLVEERKVLIPTNFRLIHFINLYKLLRGGEDVSL